MLDKQVKFTKSVAPRRMGFLGLLALMLIALVPLLPRPTIEGVGSLGTPVVGALLVYLAAMERTTWPRDRARPRIPQQWLIGALAATTFYAFRVLLSSGSEEVPFAVSRVLLLAIVVSCFIVFAQIPTESVLHWFAVGGVVLGLLVGFIGVTGAVLLEPPSPARTLGIELPWFKTAGVPRSYGEQGIILSILLAYLFGYWRSMGLAFRTLLLVSCTLVLLMGQSRNMLLASVVVVLTWLFVASRGHWVQLRLVLILSAVATFVVELLLPVVLTTGLGRAVVGEGIFETNVISRFALREGVADLIASAPFASVVGFDHADWTGGNYDEYEGIGVHNHFLATLLFVGIIAGGLTLWALFISPCLTVLRSLSDGELNAAQVRRRQVLLTALAGVLVSLNFYEGFFSFTLALVIGLLWQLGAGYDTEQRSKGELQMSAL